MSLPTVTTKKRLIVMLLVVSLAAFVLIIRLGIIQIAKCEELKKQALEQWTRGISVKAKRGIIYDRKGKKLAISINRDTVWCRPADVKKPKETAKKVAEILNLDEEYVYEKLIANQSSIKIKQWIEKEEADILRKQKLAGIDIVPGTKRYYPYGSFASFVLGHTNIDQAGQYGVERTFDKYLTGVPGRWVKTTDAVGRQLPYDNERLYEAKDGLSLVLTIDETIQHFAEKAALEALVKNEAKRVTILIMEPKTGDLLAMATMPDYDPNKPTEPLDKNLKEKLGNLSTEEKLKIWYDIWRNFPVNDSYEPGSTFKIITGASGLEENVVTPDSQFYCDGYVQQVESSKRIKCWRYYNPHGSENLVEGFQNSCNEVFVEVALRLGQEKMHKYIEAFGFGEKTGIKLTGEQSGIIPSSPESMKEVNLATISFGQGIAVTPIQLITAISAVSNGGNLMEPRIVKELVDSEGNVVTKFKPKVKRKVISEETSRTVLDILETVVSKGTGKNAYVEGYKIGGKTGTAQKVIDGKYAPGKYIASFAAVAPTDDPKITALVIIDEPSNGPYYGGVIAAPVAGELIEETLRYMDIEPNYEGEDNANVKKAVVVPDIRNKTVKEAGRIVLDLGLQFATDLSETKEIRDDAKVIDQFPLPGSNVNKGQIISFYIQNKRNENNKIIIPDLTGKSIEEVTSILNNLNLSFKIKGSGRVVNQNPKPGTEVEFNSLIEVEFNHINE